MKTVAIILSMVAFAMSTVQCATIGNSEQGALERFQQFYKDCAQRMQLSTNDRRIDVTWCALIRDGGIILANGEYSRDAALRRLEQWISDPVKLQMVKEAFLNCDNEVTLNGQIGIDKQMNFAICFIKLFYDIVTPQM